MSSCAVLDDIRDLAGLSPPPPGFPLLLDVTNLDVEIRILLESRSMATMENGPTYQFEDMTITSNRRCSASWLVKICEMNGQGAFGQVS